MPVVSREKKRVLRSEAWFNDTTDPGATAIYLERYLNFGLTHKELGTGRPIIGIAQSGSDLSPCNRHHIDLAVRVKEGIRDNGGVPLEFPLHPIQETGKRPTAALDRNLAYLSMVEILQGYPIDGVVLMTGCDKTTPSQLMAASTVGIPSIVLSGGPMLDGHYQGACVGSGTINWIAREKYAAGEIGVSDFIALAASSAPSIGHCNTMGTALSMNCIAEALGMSLPGCASIPAAYRERPQMAYATGYRIVDMICEDLTPSMILTDEAFKNAIRLATAIGASSNCVPHLIAIARHAGVALSESDWDRHGANIPLLVNCQPVGKYLGEAFHKAGGVPAVIMELISGGLMNPSCLTVTGQSHSENLNKISNIYVNRDVISTLSRPVKENAGFIKLKGNLFESAIMKVSAIDDEFRKRYLSNAEDPDAFTGRAVVFEGPEDYHKRINDPDLQVDEHSILVIRGCGPLGYPGSAEVVNMLPPDRLIKAGIRNLPCIGDGRQSGTSGAPSILHASPEAAAGGGLAKLRTGDTIRVDLKLRTVNAKVDVSTWAARESVYFIPEDQTPWQEIYRGLVEQLSDGGTVRGATKYRDTKRSVPRHSH
ncbi:IlvD/Edd family dehydratase [Ciceribacter sp. L1K22]|uniref:IlvD/Edd family dehydratase n=1 Tax=Ciceribacter sp. L1K22 TaxID=2820275 RepID=UPI0032B1436B